MTLCSGQHIAVVREVSLTGREMAVKESSQRAIIEQQFVQIADLQKANNKLKDEFVERVSWLRIEMTVNRTLTIRSLPCPPA